MDEPYNASYHGKDGYLCVEHIPYHMPLSTEFLKAGKKLGWEIIDYNGPEQIGFSYLQVNMDRGARCSASRAYLKVRRPNLEITNSRHQGSDILSRDYRLSEAADDLRNRSQRSLGRVGNPRDKRRHGRIQLAGARGFLGTDFLGECQCHSAREDNHQAAERFAVHD
ncbi:hypothetical protein G9C98_006839 [Cotesia typhae]|uniref:Glucose-methanol-choline oxidoreductase N-terminal domain-containing protein n=1 Tax=Cotesia typhae TaxID=2053667 RepID=A0A8J5R106_9HYME|nr:hypothetical protein G9C98_006839 [Cotesia typhae]